MTGTNLLVLLAVLGGALWYLAPRVHKRWVRATRWFRPGPGACYLIRVRHPRTGRVVTGYVGQTRRAPATRVREHLYGSRGAAPKPWADTVVDWRVLRQGHCSQPVLNLWELWYIRTRRPIYNVLLNRRNGRRVTPWVAARQRARRARRSVVRR